MKICKCCEVVKLITDFEIRSDNGNYRHQCKECIAKSQKRYAGENKEEIAKYQKNYRRENNGEISENSKHYYNNNKEKIYEKHKEYRKERSRIDSLFRLRRNVSNSIHIGLKRNGQFQKGISCFTHLSYSIEKLKLHIESLFESWMNWENQGKYDPKTWDDNDPTTWKWQLDHIIPHSTFKYESMDCEEFRDCWALSNLRPLSAKQNMLDGALRIRHYEL